MTRTGRRGRRARALAVAGAVLVLAVAACAGPPPAPDGPPAPGADPGGVPVRVIAFNDLHGNLEPPSGSSARVTRPDGTTVDAGGAAFLATHIARLRGEAPDSVLLSTGDNVGASPVISALFHDEPTMALLRQLGVTASVAGNHEFDEGYPELLRLQRGGCHPTDGCRFRPTYDGAPFPILSANVTREPGVPGLEPAPPSVGDGIPALAPFTVAAVGGVRVGIIGATLRELPTLVSGDALRGLRIGPEVEAINRAAALLDEAGVRAQVVLLHQGDEPGSGPEGPDTCAVAPDGPGTTIARGAAPTVDAVLTAHTHQQYVCTVGDPAGAPRPVVQGLSFGRLLSVLDLRVDPGTGDVLREQTRSDNVVVTRDVPPDPVAAALVDEARTIAAPIANERVGSIAADLTRTAAPSGESPLGSVIADAQLAATRADGARVAVTNPGGVRTDLTAPSSPAGEGDGVVTYGEAYAVQPFGNIMQTVTLTGAQLKAALEQQFELDRTLQVSDTLRYTWSRSAPIGAKVSGITIDGVPVEEATPYRVAVNNFLAGGGDGFTTLTVGTDVVGGAVDLDALVAYLRSVPVVAPPPANRITVAP